jgi:hypothetical protein
MIEYIGPLYDLLQHCTNHYLRLHTLDFCPHYTNPSELYLDCQSSQSHIATDLQSVSQSVRLWCRAPSGAHDQIFIIVWQLRSCFSTIDRWRSRCRGRILWPTPYTYTYGLVLWGALSDERTGLSFLYAAGPCQRSLSWVQVPRDSRPYFTVSDLRLPFSSPPTTHRATVGVFDPASTRIWTGLSVMVDFSLYRLRLYHAEDTSTA